MYTSILLYYCVLIGHCCLQLFFSQNVLQIFVLREDLLKNWEVTRESGYNNVASLRRPTFISSKPEEFITRVVIERIGHEG